MIIMNQNLIRAGSGRMGVWNLKTAPTHGNGGTDIIGEKMDPEYLDTTRDLDTLDQIELSSGSKHDNEVQFVKELSEHRPAIWTAAPSFTASTVLSTSSTRAKPSPSVWQSI